MIAGATKKTAFSYFLIFLMLVLVFITFYPFYYIAIASFSAGNMVAGGEVTIIPKELTLSSYKVILRDHYFMKSILNTVLYTVVGTGINLLMSVLCAYPLSIKSFSGRKVLSKLIIFTMFFSGGMVPLYLVVRSLSLINSIWSIVLPGAIGTYYMIIIRTYFASIPAAMREAAYIDGANDFTLLFRIYIPLSIPTLITMALFYASGHWNSFFNALLFLTEKSRYTVQLILRNMLIDDLMSDQYTEITQNADIVPTTLKYAAIIVSTIPVLCIYPFIQKYFVKGVMIGSMKE